MPLLPVIKENKTNNNKNPRELEMELKKQQSYWEKQEKIVKVCMEHNFIRIHETKTEDWPSPLFLNLRPLQKL